MAVIFTFDLQSPLGNECDWEKSGYILQFLWVASQRLLKEVSFESTVDDNTVDWQELRSSRCIFDDPNDTSPSSSLASTSSSSMLALSTSIQAQTKLMEKMQDSFEQSSSDRMEKFGDLHNLIKLLIRNASSRNGEVTPIKSSLTHEAFFKKKSISQSKQFLIESLSDAGYIVKIETGLVTALVNGQFLRDCEDTPSNFSIFLVPKRKPMSSSSFKSGIILRLKSLHVKWDVKDMNDAVKQGHPSMR